MKAVERQSCACPCDCGSSAAGAMCWCCLQDIHRPSRAVRKRLFANLEVWTGIVASLTPDSSSGISAKALRTAIDTYERQKA